MEKKKKELWNWNEPTFGKSFILGAGAIMLLLISWKAFLILVGAGFASAFIYLIWITLIL